MAIFFVIWGHCIQYLSSSYHADEPIYRTIYSFHMPLFMMISGFFSLSSYQLSFTNFFYKKFKQLLLPCISWGVIVCGGVWLNNNIISNGNKSIQEYSYIFYHCYWFLKSCFLCYLLGWAVYNIGKAHRSLFLIISIIISQCISEFHLQIMYPCFVVGVELKRNNKFLRKVVQCRIEFAILFLIMLCFWGKSFWEHTGTLYNAFGGLFQFSSLHMFDWLYDVYRIMIGIVGSCALIGLFVYYYDEKGHSSKTTTHVAIIGRFTLEIYCLQAILLEIIIAKIISLDSLSFFSFNFIVTPLISIIVLYACYIIVEFVNKSALLRFVMFGKNK